MNKQPVSYFQTDPRWKYVSYSAKGETTTIGASGCGPTAMAMVLATWANSKVTPYTECAWALAHGYKAPHQGTYYGYFGPAAARYGLVCKRVNTNTIYGNSSSAYHNTVKDAIKRGCLVIACMGKGLWTSSGHYVVVWDIIGDTIYINDPASSKTVRTRGSYSLFKQQVKYYWIIDPPKHVTPTKPNNQEEENEDMLDGKTIAERLNTYLAKQPVPEWAKKELEEAKALGITDGEDPNVLVPRYQASIMALRAYKKINK